METYVYAYKYLDSKKKKKILYYGIRKKKCWVYECFRGFFF